MLLSYTNEFAPLTNNPKALVCFMPPGPALISQG